MSISPPLPPEPGADRRERKQWRGKVRVSERRNAAGDVQYRAEFRPSWWLSFDWLAVESAPSYVDKGGHRRCFYIFETFEAAKLAGQLKWNAEAAERAEVWRTRFAKWRKVWP